MSRIIAECLECEAEWRVVILGEDCPECDSANVLYEGIRRGFSCLKVLCMNSHWSDIGE